MAKAFDLAVNGGDPAALDDEAFRAVQDAEEHARTLREETLAHERARLRAVMAVLKATPEELLGLPTRRRRRSDKTETQ